MLRSFTDRQRALLLAAAAVVLYTPQREHFGIVPLEAMAAARPVIACDSGGPRESILDGRTGFLCEASPTAFAHAMQALSVSPFIMIHTQSLSVTRKAQISSSEEHIPHQIIS